MSDFVGANLVIKKDFKDLLKVFINISFKTG